MSSLRSICSYECTLLIASKYLALILVSLNCTVEEDNRDISCLSLIYDSLGSVYRTGCNNVYN